MGGRGLPKRKALSLLLMALLLLGYSIVPAFGATVDVTDALGRTVRVSLPVQRVVTLNSDALEVIWILGAKELVVGVETQVAREPWFWGDLAKRPTVGRWSEPNMEKIASLAPDLVLAYAHYPGQVLEKKMIPLGIPVLRLDCYKIDTLEREVLILGRLLRRQKEALRFCRWHQRHLEMIHKRIMGVLRHPAVYIESYTDYHTCGPGSGGDEMCALAGGRNIAAGLSIPYPRVTPEWVVAQDPDVIIKAAAYTNGYLLRDPGALNRRMNAILRRPAFNQIKAVREGNVHVMDSAVWAGPRAIIGLAYMARWFHPGLFPDLDPGAWHKEYFKEFLHIPYKGVYVSIRNLPGRFLQSPPAPPKPGIRLKRVQVSCSVR